MLERIFFLCLFFALIACRESPKMQGGNEKTQWMMSQSLADKGFENEREALAYAMGMETAQGLLNRHIYLKEKGIELDREQIKMGFLDAVSDSYIKNERLKKARLDSNDLERLIHGLERTISNVKKKNFRQEGVTNHAAGKSFLEQNSKKRGVITLKSGLQYKVIEAGIGLTPRNKDTVIIEYIGRLIDDTEFVNSHQSKNEPTSFRINGVIEGWSEALMLMKQGDKWELTIPSDLAYGLSRRKGVPSNSVVIFEIKLLKILKAES